MGSEFPTKPELLVIGGYTAASHPSSPTVRDSAA
jgi:hypothetical protein